MRLRFLPRGGGPVLRDALPASLELGQADVAQSLHQSGRDVQFSLSGKVLGHANQVGRWAVRIDVDEALVDHPRDIVYFSGPSSLLDDCTEVCDSGSLSSVGSSSTDACL